MEDVEKIMVTVRHFLNNCCFDRNGKAFCRRDSANKDT